MLRRVRESGVLTPALACTGNALPRDLAHYQTVGFADIVTKPFKVSDLRHAMKLVLPACAAALSSQPGVPTQ